MKLLEYDQMIIQGMLHLNELTQFDTEWLSENFHKVHAFINHPIPLGVDFSLEDYATIETLCFKKEGLHYCMASTMSQLEFVFIPLTYKQQKKGLIKIGPFITNPMDNQKLSDMLVALNLPLRHRETLHNFYESLSLIPSHYTNNLGHIGMNLFGHKLSLPKMTNYQSSQVTIESTMVSLATNEQKVIERRYAYEKQLRKAITNGDIEQLRKAIQLFEKDTSFNDRFPDNPLRSSKNMAIVFNTISRVSAEAGGLHPLYLHQLSDKYANLIEKATTRTAVNQLNTLMFEDYTNMVRLHAYPQVSPLIRKVIDTIQFNLDQPLSVSILAKRFGLKPSNLANQFKKETQKTISEFIHQLRIQEAVYYLKNFTLSIGEISRLVGYPDHNYFTRIFKKYHHTSPSEYRKSSGTS